MKLRSIASLLLLAVVGAVVVAGCGGGGSSSGGGGSSDFASTAEAACTKADGQIAALGTPQQADVLPYLERTEDVIAALHTQVEAAGGTDPADTAYTEGLATALPILTEMTNAARSENFDAVRELSDELVQIELGAKAEAAGLKSCAEVPVSA